MNEPTGAEELKKEKKKKKTPPPLIVVENNRFDLCGSAYGAAY